jgi:hypothetical protein
MAKQMDSKGGLVRAAAISAAVKSVYPKALGRWMRSVRRAGSDGESMFMGGAYEGITLAWESWQPERGPWEAHAYAYACEYGRRALTLESAVVSTNYSRRKLRYEQAAEGDATREFLSAHGCLDKHLLPSAGGDVDCVDGSARPDEMVASQDALLKITDRLNEVLADLDPDTSLGKLAPEIVASWLNDGDNVGTIATRNGFARLTGYRSADALREAVREALADLM